MDIFYASLFFHTHLCRPSGLVGNHVHILNSAKVVSSILFKTRICILASIAESVSK